MKKITGNIWRVACDAIVIPTNGNVNRHGEAVMGRGLALQAARSGAARSSEVHHAT